MNKGFIVAVIIMVSLKANGREVTLKEYHDTPPEKIHQIKPVMRDRPVRPASPSSTGSSVSLNIDQLKDHPLLVKKALLSSLLSNDEQGVSLLLPVFKQQQPDNHFYINWSEAILAHKASSHGKATELYRKVIGETPQAIAARLQLAVVLYENYDNHAARNEFKIIQQQKDLPEQIVILINRYLQALDKRQRWKFSGNLNHLDDDNVNNAPKPGTRLGFWSTAEPESARGVGYYASASKKILLASHIFHNTQIDGSGKYYITNHKYDEARLRFASGLSYQNVKTEIALLPFTERNWYSGGYSAKTTQLKTYSATSGARAEINHWISDNWLFFTAIEYGKQNYIKRDYLDGNNIFLSATLLYSPDNNQYWLIGNDYYRENTADKDSAYAKKSLRIGWGQRWPYGISTRITGSYAQRNYFAKDFFGIQKMNDEYTALLSAWHEDFHFLGLTPKLVLSYQKSDSNHPFYQYDKKKVYLELEKTFR